MGSNFEKLALVKEWRLRQARRSFASYRQLINPKLKWGWWTEEVATELQVFYDDLVAGKKPVLIIQAPPQHGKSVQIVDFVSWLAGKNPDLKTIYGSFSDRLGLRANLRLQRTYDSEIFREIFPETNIARVGEKAGSGRYTRNQSFLEYVDKEGSFRNTTVMGPITGESLDLGVIDDPIKGRRDANSQTVRDSTWNWLTDDFLTRFSEDAGLLIILTRWHVDDPVGRLIAKDKSIRVLSYPAIAEEDEPHRKKGEPLFPEHKSLEFLLKRKSIMPEPNWLALYQQRPIVAEGNHFKPDKIEVVEAIPAGCKFVRAWDFAATVGDGDWTVGLKMGSMPDGRFIIADVVRFQGGPEEVETALRNTTVRDGNVCKARIPQDPAQAGKTQAKRLIKLLAGYSATAKLVSGDKTLRSSGFAAQVNIGNVLMLRAEWNQALIDELRSFPNGKNDDQVDAGSDAFEELTGTSNGLLDFIEQQMADNAS